ncbi:MULTISPECIES: NAD(P)-dependent oxidoreductase [unclassified Pseudomonas]|jgi:3-hydroxyisobutyrate dehydrogenase-like beta-hydroxyacid dehydrogenase|uniref:NAD(P)-dependent oxidoreductase n=2 Tax=unclassified Pseudomonas TaxID=196821 RepID=UPI00216B5590|nr:MULTISPECIES: NAD(P)-dependent oxidoreductase [unclassified Pseudomonas]
MIESGKFNMKMAFIGLGQMGRPMAINLLRSHPGLLVNTASGRAYAELERLGAIATDDRRALADCDLVFLSLPDDEVVDHFLFGAEGIAQWMCPGSIVVDTSTISYAQTLSIETKLAALGIRFLDAPVSGMASRAVDGTLTAMCGGSEQVFNEVAPYLEKMASNILYMGAAGAGQLAKLINQLLFDINCAAIAEILPMAVKLGLNAEKVAAIVNSGTGRSYASEFFVPHILAGRFSSGYPLKHAYKDLISGAGLSAKMGIPLPVLSAATATYQTAVLQGHGDSDKGAMIKVYERLLGVEFRAAAPSADGSTAHLQ